MENNIIIGIDQSTSGTKALAFSANGEILGRYDLPHRQIIDENGWISHDPMEIYRNTVASVIGVLEKTGIARERVAGIGLSNQRETAVVWNRKSGLPVCDAIVWQCARGASICQKIDTPETRRQIKSVSGLPLSPYFAAAKFAWAVENAPIPDRKNLCCGTVDSWLVFKLTGEFRTDYSNASRTQLFDLHTLRWSDSLCACFGLDPAWLPKLTDSNGFFGETNLEGYFPKPVPIHGVLGDSHGALYGQGCLTPGSIKATYGTGSSVMMNVGSHLVSSEDIVTSLAWCMDGKAQYVLEGNINYSAAVIKWLEEDLQLISSAKEVEALAKSARNMDGMYLVPAFSGLGAPYWKDQAKAMICGMTRNCGKAELVRAAEECIAYQITDILSLMQQAYGEAPKQLRVDGGPTRDAFLMQFQADVSGVEVVVPQSEELSGIGAVYAAGLALGVFDESIRENRPVRARYLPSMEKKRRDAKYAGWKEAVKLVLQAK